MHGGASRVAKSKCVGLRSKVHKHILEAFFWNVGPKLTFSTTIHPQTKHLNGDLNQYLKNYVSVDQHDWADCVGTAEFSYNEARHSATKQSPFNVAYGVDPL